MTDKKKKTSGRRAPARIEDRAPEGETDRADAPKATEPGTTQYTEGGWIFGAVIVGLLVLAIAGSLLLS